MNEPTVLDPPIFSASTMHRLLYVNCMLTVGLFDWLMQMTHPEQNLGNWLAAVAGAFVIRIVLPPVSIRQSVAGWFVGVCVAFLFASSLSKLGFFAGWDSFAIWGFVAMLGDIAMQCLGWFVRIGRKVGGTVEANPGQAFDDGLDRVEKVTNVWVRIKAPLLDLLKSGSDLLNSFNKKT